MNNREKINLTAHYENFNHLIKDVRDKAGFSIASMARTIDVHRNTQVNYENDRDPGIDYLVAFSDLTNVSFWQLVAQRVQFGSCNQEQIDRALDEIGPILPHGKNTAADEGSATDLDTPPGSQTLLETCQHLLSHHQQNENIKVFQQNGNSMAPTINEGDSLLVDTADTTLRDGQIFFVKISNMFVARRFQNLPDGGILIIGDNTQFESIKVDQQDVGSVTIIGRLLSSISHYS